MIELRKDEYPLLKKLFPDDHSFVEVPMIVNDKRGRAWLDDRENPNLGLIWMGEMIFIEGDGNSDILKWVFAEFTGFGGEVNCHRRFTDILKVSFEKVTESISILYDHDGQAREFPIPRGFKLSEINEKLFYRLNETGEDWLGSMFYDGMDFVHNSYGFVLIRDRTLCSAAVAFSIDGKRANIGIATDPQFRNKGLSTFCTSICVNRTLENKLKPVWVTGPDNIASQTVAMKNGFKPSIEFPCFWIGD